MTPARLISGLAFSLVLGAGALQAQTPFFNDGTALGGSLVFSEGLNPLANPARFDQPQPQPLYGFTYITGDQRSTDNATALKNMAPLFADAQQISNALRQLATSPWGLRTRAYGISMITDTLSTSFTHEELNSVLAAADIRPSSLDSTDALLQNTSTADLRRAKVDRITTGIGSTSQGLGSGLTFRVEKWAMGEQTAALVPGPGQIPLDSSSDLLGLSNTTDSTVTVAVDFGFTYELAPGVRLGGTVNRLNAKRLWDVEEKPQGRVGLQVDLGTLAALSVESDVNEAMRMPFPVKQRTSSASLRLAANPTVTFLLGGERKKIGESLVTRAGATLQIHFTGWQIALGMQFSKDQPLQGISTFTH